MLDIKFVKRVVNSQMTEEDKVFLKEIFDGNDIKLLKEELKLGLIKIGDKEFLKTEINSAQYMNNSHNAYLFLIIINQLFYFRMNKEKEKAWKFLNNEKEAEKAGWYQKSEKWHKNPANQKKLLDWCDKANPNIDNVLWENEINKAMIINYLKLK